MTASRFMPDTSCIVPVLSTNHVHAQRARDAINSRLDAGDSMFLAAHSLLETYANLTSSPARPRPSTEQVVALIEAFASRATGVLALDGPGYAALLPRLAERVLVGGAVYDALIFECARLAQVDVLLTFNLRDFGRFGPDVRVVVPQP